MAVPRPVLLAVLGVALCAAAILATRGARDPGGMVTAAPVPSAPAPKAKPAGKQPPAKPGAGGRHEAKPDAKPSAGPEADRPAAKPQPKPEARNTSPAVPGPLDGVRAEARAAKNAGKPAPAAPARPEPAASLATRVTAALDRGDAVVFLFTRAGAADDTSTRQSVAALRGRDRVMVVKAGLQDLATFRPVLEGAGVSQVPSVVIAREGKPARLIEGYVDRGTLRQRVADALR